MIFFCNKKTGEIISTINGRVHDPLIIEKAWVQPSNMAKEDIVKFVLPYTIKESGEYVPDVPYKDLIYAFEDLKEHVRDYLAVFDQSGKVINFEKKI